MQYSQDYVAFIDILGFSNYVSNEGNAEKTQDLFAFIEKFRYFYNTSPQLNVKISFFSDSIVIVSPDIESIIIAIWMAESYLQNNLGLLFRGGICHGQYYHRDNVTFGPAVVSAYSLEKHAIYSRIIIDTEISQQLNNEELLLFRDVDGWVCCNPYCTIIDENTSYGPNGITYPEDIEESIESSFIKHKGKLLCQIEKHKGTAIIDKYLWRIRPYNYTCNLICNMDPGEILFKDIDYHISDALKEKIITAKITEKDIIAILSK